jgi:hypothetical protein
MSPPLPCLLAVGTILKGFCGGWFGRDSYADKMVIGVGFDWVVVRNLDTNRPELAYLKDGLTPGEAAAWQTGEES